MDNCYNCEEWIEEVKPRPLKNIVRDDSMTVKMKAETTIPEPGTKVKLKITGYFGNIVETEGKIVKTPYQHGWLNANGSWALYPGHGFDIPCYKVAFLPKRKRKPIIITVRDIQEIEVIG